MNNHRDWRSDLATEKQITYIEEMQEFSEIPLPLFTGKTKGDAADYIDKYIKIAHQRALDYNERGYSF